MEAEKIQVVRTYRELVMNRQVSWLTEHLDEKRREDAALFFQWSGPDRDPKPVPRGRLDEVAHAYTSH